MARTKEFDEKEALEAAIRVFWEKGYEATSLSDLTTTMRIQRPSIYSTYGDKKELFVASLVKYSESMIRYFEHKLGQDMRVTEAIRSCFQDIIDAAYKSDPIRGCFSVNTMAELAPHEPRFAQMTGEHQKKLVEIFQDALDKGIRSGELKPDLNAADVAKSLVVFLTGLFVTLKAKPERKFVEDTVEGILLLLK